MDPDLFGKPNEGIHSYRIPYLDLAAVDVISVIFLAFIIYILIGKQISFMYLISGIFAAGIISHRWVGVKTKLDVFLFGK